VEVGRIVLFELDGLSLLALVDVVPFKFLDDFLNFLLIFIVDQNGLFLFLLVISLNLDSSFRHERLERNLFGDFYNLVSICFHGDIEHSSVNIGS